MEKTVKAKLLAIREGNYVMYVFRNLDNNEYLMCTKLPNWQVPDINIGDVGFLLLEYVVAGQDFFDPQTFSTSKYLYTNVYFRNFIKESVKTNENLEIVL